MCRLKRRPIDFRGVWPMLTLAAMLLLPVAPVPALNATDEATEPLQPPATSPMMTFDQHPDTISVSPVQTIVLTLPTIPGARREQQPPVSCKGGSPAEVLECEAKMLGRRGAKPDGAGPGDGGRADLLVNVTPRLEAVDGHAYMVTFDVEADRRQADAALRRMDRVLKLQVQREIRLVLDGLAGWQKTLEPDQLGPLRRDGTLTLPVRAPFERLDKLEGPQPALNVGVQWPGGARYNPTLAFVIRDDDRFLAKTSIPLGEPFWIEALYGAPNLDLPTENALTVRLTAGATTFDVQVVEVARTPDVSALYRSRRAYFAKGRVRERQ